MKYKRKAKQFKTKYITTKTIAKLKDTMIEMDCRGYTLQRKSPVGDTMVMEWRKNT